MGFVVYYSLPLCSFYGHHRTPRRRECKVSGSRNIANSMTPHTACMLGYGRFSARYGRKTVITSFGSIRGETFSPDGKLEHVLPLKHVNDLVDDLPAVTQYLGVPYGMSPTGQASVVVPATLTKHIFSIASAWPSLPPSGPISPRTRSGCRRSAFSLESRIYPRQSTACS